MSTNYIGQALSRVDGRPKVTGEARYAAEYAYTGDVAYGFVVSSAITKGKITKIDTARALKLEGVLQVFTHENVSGLAWFDWSYKDQDAPKSGSPFRPLQDNKIQFSQQPVALVVAESFELARHASTLIDITYKEDTDLVTNIPENLDKARKPKGHRFPPPKPKGDADEAFEASTVKHQSDYYHGAEHHNPMEMFSTTVIYNDGKLTVYDKTQGVTNSQSYITGVFGLSNKDVHVLSPFVGGAFGSGLRPQYQLYMAVLAALELKRSVKVVLTRQQMFSFGHRPSTLQQIAIGADMLGNINSIINTCYSETSQFEDYTENIVTWSPLLYKTANFKLEHNVVPIDAFTPLDMRAPGGATGVYAIECAIDEMAYKLNMDPMVFRLKNYTETNVAEGKPFSSKELRECYHQGAEKFGWDKRNPAVGAMQEGDMLIGWGVAAGAWEAQQMPSRAKAELSVDGKLTVSSGTSDIGTGTYTIMAQIAAETLGIPIENVTSQLGDTDMPMAPLQGGSWTAGTIGSAIKVVCEDIKSTLLKLAGKIKNAGFKDAEMEDVLFADGNITLLSNPAISLPITEVMRLNDKALLTETSTSIPNPVKQMGYSRYTHCATFAEVKVDKDYGTVYVTRMVTAVAAGHIINPKTSRSQVLGGMVWGQSMALEEDSMMDTNIGRFMNHNLSEYHVPVNADIKNMEVLFVEEHDDIVNPLGIKGLGEIGIVGSAAAIANAVYHATGARVRDLPITLDKVMDKMAVTK